MYYPDKLNAVFNKLIELGIKPIIVGGYIRDSLLRIASKDIDVELYGISSFDKLEIILEEFGEVNSVGKSFGVCKLQAFGLDIDFSFPRKDSKVSKGHKGFLVEIDPNLDFKTASSRRDFTINSMGYDLKDKKILDPFNGQRDLKNNLLRATDSKKFQEDPLRVYRAVQLSARFDLTLDEELLKTAQTMVQNGLMKELAKERIFQEIKKLLLKAQNISRGIKLLHMLGLFKKYHTSCDTTDALERASLFYFRSEKQKLIVMFAIWLHTFTLDTSREFLKLLSDDKNLLHSILSLLKNQDSVHLNNFTDFDLYMLAREVKIEDFVLFLKALSESNTALFKIEELKERAKRLNILNQEAPALLGGKDLLALGLKPSKSFSIILEKAYLAQLNGRFTTHKGGVFYLKKELLS